MTNLKNEILAKSMSLFLLKSYNEVSIKEIQVAVGCSRGVMYHHFESKKQIFEEVVKKYILPAFSSFSNVAKEKRLTLRDAIDSSIAIRVRYIQSLKENNSNESVDFLFFKFLFQLGELYDGFSDIADNLQCKETEAWKEVVLNAIKNGEIKEYLDADFVTQYFVSLPYGLGLLRAFAKGINCEDIKDSYIKFYNLIRK